MKNTPGDLVWYELITSDPKAAIAFYSAVVGWTTQPWENGQYTMWLGSHGPLGGVMQLPADAVAKGIAPFWQTNLQVASVDETLAKVKQLGGTVFIPPHDVPEVGRIAVIIDPQGASIAIFQPLSAMDSRDLTKQGEFSWHELYTTDVEAAFAFYHQIAGWERISEFDMGPNGKYVIWGRNGKQLGGMMVKPPDLKTPDGRDVPPSWLYYVTINDLDAAFERAKSLGAMVINKPMDVPGGQRIAQLLDPQGVAFALVTPPKA